MNPALLVILIGFTIFGVLCISVPRSLIRRGGRVPVPGKRLSKDPRDSQVRLLRVLGVVIVVGVLLFAFLNRGNF